MTDFDLIKLRDFILAKTGIYIDDDKLFKIYKRKFEDFIQKQGFDDFSSFYNRLVFKKDEHLLQELINLTTVNETYFFREAYQFKTLVEEVLSELDGLRPPHESINILTAPSSSGEELYSIAIYIMEYAKEIFYKRDFVLVGIDIDSVMIQKARQGIFNQRSVSKIPPHLLQKYFIKEGNQYKIIDEIRKGLTFKVVNVMDFYAMKKLGRFDVIFSRNMLIYFDEKTRKEILATFHALLKPHGYLFLGHAEKVPVEMEIFKRVKKGESIIYQKA
ncbi:CheR family methyltransferase [Nitratiruptor sp. SB155-2]|uniref:CheR family methyltransferase n=1 Tax=Nitratiruptor sp. (strain SB155-2) TaxID=387092 RepID=UPI0001586D93|nr:CheR family methyltransferase [Nitratiruptor sp. SB155-2]BAF69389.1 chemotaxis protein methyltransferase [Nitratiruptor sp. SB155-2]